MHWSSGIRKFIWRGGGRGHDPKPCHPFTGCEFFLNWIQQCQRKQLTFYDHTTGFPVKWLLSKDFRNSILMTHHYPDLASTSDWLKQISLVVRSITSPTQIWVLTRHQYGISSVVSWGQSFCGETAAKSQNVSCFLRLCKASTSTFTFITCKILNKDIWHTHTPVSLGFHWEVMYGRKGSIG